MHSHEDSGKPGSFTSPDLQTSAIPPAKPGRLESVDFLRGLVMIVMALDHARDYFTNVAFDPLDLTQTTPELFLTRWITHFCAPVFVFLAGTGAFLSGTRGKTKAQISRLLLSRGLWLILLEFTIIRLAWQFNVNFRIFHGQVIWAIGFSMVALAGLVYLPKSLLAIFGILTVLLHNLLDSVSADSFGSLWWLWRIIHVPEAIPLGERSLFNPLYSLIPWVGVMACGYSFGQILLFEPQRRRRVLLQLGLGLTALFVVLRASNLYGDPVPWSTQENPVYSLLSFINTEKYPASLLFLLMTLGPSIAVLPLLERNFGRLGKAVILYGRVPLFYYVLHLYLIHALAVVAGMIQGFTFSRMCVGHWAFPKKYGFDLPVVYGAWVLAVVMLYPACVWFGNVKKRAKGAWVSYF